MIRTSYARQAVTAFGSFLIILLFAANTLAAEFVSVRKDGVNIRSGPSTSNEILWEVFKGFPLKIVKKRGNWSQTVDFEGDEGWIYSPLLSNKKTVIVKVKTANMRIGPGQDYEIIATVKYGVVFKPVDSEGDWIKVSHADGTIGWIYRNLLWPESI